VNSIGNPPGTENSGSADALTAAMALSATTAVMAAPMILIARNRMNAPARSTSAASIIFQKPLT